MDRPGADEQFWDEFLDAFTFEHFIKFSAKCAEFYERQRKEMNQDLECSFWNEELDEPKEKMIQDGKTKFAARMEKWAKEGKKPVRRCDPFFDQIEFDIKRELKQNGTV